MTAFGRWSLVLALGLFCLPFTSCTAKYQDMLRDRDETIRDLEGELSTSRGENDRLQRALQQARGELTREHTEKPRVGLASQSKVDPVEDLQNRLRQEGLGKEIQVRYRRGRVSIGIPSRVTFASGSTKISKEGADALRRLARVLSSQWGQKKVYVEGHTDADPIRKSKKRYRSNRHLSAERADAVASFFSSKCGLPEKRLVIVGYGPYDPVSSADKTLNRRVEIIVAE